LDITEKTAFGDTNTFASKGGLATMSQASSAGMVLVMSIWVIPFSSRLNQALNPHSRMTMPQTCSGDAQFSAQFLSKLNVLDRLDAPYP
jgi:hypothetical protein